MIKSLMYGVEEKNVNAVVETLDLNAFYFPTLFPLKQTKLLTWKTLNAKVGIRIAADLVARGARLSPKARNTIKRIEGDIPKIGIERTMDEDELTEYDTLLALAEGDADLVQLIEAWAEDMQFCWTGVATRIEFMALYQMSHAGKLRVTSENNAHVVSEYDADYDIPADQKVGSVADWQNAATAKPFTKDLREIMKKSRTSKKGSIRLKHAWINQETFNYLVETDECQKLCASYVQNALGMQTIPSLETVNQMMAKLQYLYGLQFHILDQDLSVESKGEIIFSGNPFADNVVLLTEGAVLGNTWWKTPIDMKVTNTAATKIMREYCLLKKFANEDPVEEITQGIANAFPAWSGSERTYSLDTKNQTWNEGK